MVGVASTFSGVANPRSGVGLAKTEGGDSTMVLLLALFSPSLVFGGNPGGGLFPEILAGVLHLVLSRASIRGPSRDIGLLGRTASSLPLSELESFVSSTSLLPGGRTKCTWAQLGPTYANLAASGDPT